MNTFINKLINFHEEGKVELINFEDIASGEYSEKSSDTIERHLQSLASAGILKYVRLDIGFHIEILQLQELKEIQAALNSIDTADEETKKLLNDIAIELKEKSPNEAKQIIMEYRQKMEEIERGFK